MRFPISRWLTPATVAFVLLGPLSEAPAQQAKRLAGADPLDPAAVVPPLTYESSFTQYRRLRADAPISWRDANDTVGRVGGWRSYAREAREAASAAAPPASAAPSPTDRVETMPHGHGGHKMP